MQQMGRAGRDGRQSSCIVYYNLSDISANKVHVQDALVKLLLLTTCRRKYLCEYFGCVYINSTADPKFCCDNCAAESNSTVKASPSGLEVTRKVDKATQDVVYSVLLQYFQSENEVVSDEVAVPDAFTCLSRKLAKEISAKCRHYTNEDDIAAEYPMLKPEFVSNIASLIKFCLST